jgi:parvulin-like peptidyl-prolyl isomerase
MRTWWVIIATTIVLTACSTGTFDTIIDDNPGATISITKLTEDRADLFLRGIESFCPDLNADTFHRVQILDDNTSTVQIVTDGTVACTINTDDPDYAEKKVAVLVNDEPIYLADIQRAVQRLPQEQRTQSEQQVLTTLVNRELMLQHATEIGITPQPGDVDRALQRALNTTTFQVNPDTIRDQVRNTLLLQQLTQRIIEQATINITQNDVRTYYETNKDQLQTPTQYTIRQIQINIGDRGVNATRDKAQTVHDLTNTTGFCQLVQQFSDDTTSLDNCGRYTFTSSQLVPAVADAVQGMEPGETRMVQSDNAYHIVELLRVSQGGEASLDDARDQIRTILRLEAQQRIVQDYIDRLRSQSNIITYI